MKICIISTAALPAPVEDSYGGLEAITGYLTLEFAKNGHDVTLITTKGSAWEGEHPIMRDGQQIAKMRVIGTIEPMWYGAAEQDHYKAYKGLIEREFSGADNNNTVILDHTWLCYAYFSKKIFPKMNIVHTHHGALGFHSPPINLHPRFIGLSMGHAQYISSVLNVPVRYIHNGIPLPQFPNEGFDPVKMKGDYLLSLNRITDEKGIHDAIDVALATGQKIIIAGDDTKVNSQEYVNRIIEMCRNSNGMAQYYGLVDNNTKNKLIMNSKALIACPKNSWIEAFGLYVIEGMSMYKPFLGLRGTVFRHGYNDFVQNGYNGFLADTPEELKQYVSKIDDIDINNCRKTVEEKFTKEIMGLNYIGLCQKILEGDQKFLW